jgi:hypothetical protein
MRLVRPARAAAIGAAALALAAPALAQGYGYQPPPYSYMAPSYSYEPPGYTYTPPGYYRRHYRLNTPDYYDAYDHPQSAYGDPRARRQWRPQHHDPVYNRFGNPRNPTDVWNSAPPYQSEGR